MNKTIRTLLISLCLFSLQANAGIVTTAVVAGAIALKANARTLEKVMRV